MLKTFSIILIFFTILLVHQYLKTLESFSYIEKFKNGTETENMWFSPNDFNKHKTIIQKGLHGFVLPHASTKYTGGIISHTLRFKPLKKFNRVLIMYLPSSQKPNIDNKYYHEYFVPLKSIKHYIENVWKIKNKVTYDGFNMFDQTNELKIR